MSRKVWNRKLELNILRCYHRATVYDVDAGMFWYQRAHEESIILSERYSIPVERVVGVIAAISPGSHWGRNLIDADVILKTFSEGTRVPTIGAYGRRNVDKALRILRGEFPLTVLPETGPKVRSFFGNILFPLESNSVTIDRHAKSIAWGYSSKNIRGASDSELSTVRPSEYEFIAWHYRKIAERYGLVPNQLQAICWITWRRLRGQLDQQDLFV